MVKINEQYVVDKEGHKVGVFLDIKTYEKMLRQLEELEELRAYDAAKAGVSEQLPFDKAVAEIERSRC